MTELYAKSSLLHFHTPAQNKLIEMIKHIMLTCVMEQTHPRDSASVSVRMTIYTYATQIHFRALIRMYVRWMHPLTCIVTGPTQSGKTKFVKWFIQHVEGMVTPVPTKIIWSYGECQPAYQPLLDKVSFVQGLPDLPQYSQEPLLVVIDDQIHGVDQRVTSLFMKGSHHRNLIVIYIVQNLFDRHKEHCTISLMLTTWSFFKIWEMGPRLFITFAKPLYWRLTNLTVTSWSI